jgi:glutamate synthase (NADPH/NADH) small chain
VAYLPWGHEEPEGGAPDRLTTLADEILERCRGEGPANCVARCPLHVDARGYVQLANQGRYREALQRVREKLPFPGILGYICTHPCELHCKRIDHDSAVRVRDVKRFLAEWEPGEPQHLLDREPQRPERVAVVGSGPAGLIAAHDLQRGGYQVTLFERESNIGGCLVNKIPPWRLPRSVTARDLSIIAALRIQLRTGVCVGREIGLDDLRKDHDAVLLLCGYQGGLDLLRDDGRGLRRTIRETVWADPVTCESGIPGVFVGGEAVSGPGSVIDALALGRRSAESARRHLTGRDLREGRETPLPRRLLWTLEIDEDERRRRARTPVTLRPYDDPLSELEMREEADRCLDCECGLCVEECEFLAKHCRSPKDLARCVKNGFEEPDALKMVYSCNLCSLCASVCPENLDTGALSIEARRKAVTSGKGPLSQHRVVVSSFERGVSKTFRLLMPEPGRSRSKRLFFPGCSLPSTGPDNTIRLYEELRRHFRGTGVLMYCCGSPVRQLGMDEEAIGAKEQIVRMARSVGAEELITVCPDCTSTLKEQATGLRITTAWELLAAEWEPRRRFADTVVSIRDSCKARHEPGVRDAVRRLVEGAGAVVEETELRGELARCCGHGGRIEPVDADLSRRIARRCADESALPMVAYCSVCRAALAGCGKDAVHLLDFLFSADWRKASRGKPPGRISGRVNRLKTKWAFRRLQPLGAE